MTSCRDEYFFFFFYGISASQTFSVTPLFGGRQQKKSRRDAKKKQVKFSFYYKKMSLSLIAFFSQGKNASQLRKADFTDILSFS